MYTHGICNIASKWFFGREQLPYNTKKEQAFVENLWNSAFRKRRLILWLTYWLTDRLTDWLTDWQTDWLTTLQLLMKKCTTDRQTATSSRRRIRRRRRRRIWEIIDREFGKTVEGVSLQPLACWDYRLCVVRKRFVRRADHSSRGVTPNVLCLNEFEYPHCRCLGPLVAVASRGKKNTPLIHSCIQRRCAPVQQEFSAMRSA